MGFLKSTYNFARHPYLPDSRRFWIGLSIAVPLVGIGLSAGLWGWLNGEESASTTIRNVGLIIAGLTALPIAVWRGIVADKQSGAAQSQAVSTQQGLRNERYQKGAEMLGSQVLSVRLGGIYALQRLAKEHPEEYHVQNLRLLCAFVRNPTEDKKYEAKLMSDKRLAREDIQTIINLIIGRKPSEMELEQSEGFRLNFSNAYLNNVFMIGANLSRAIFRKTDLSAAIFWKTDLSRAVLLEANLSNTKLWDANLSGAWLTIITDSGGVESARGLTQAQLNEARAHIDNPPMLDGVLDAETGKPLVWNGKNDPPLMGEDHPPKTHPHPAHKPPGPAPCSGSPGSDHTSGASCPAPRARFRKAPPPTPGRQSSGT